MGSDKSRTHLGVGHTEGSRMVDGKKLLITASSASRKTNCSSSSCTSAAGIGTRAWAGACSSWQPGEARAACTSRPRHRSTSSASIWAWDAQSPQSQIRSCLNWSRKISILNTIWRQIYPKTTVVNRMMHIKADPEGVPARLDLRNAAGTPSNRRIGSRVNAREHPDGNDGAAVCRCLAFANKPIFPCSNILQRCEALTFGTLLGQFLPPAL